MLPNTGCCIPAPKGFNIETHHSHPYTEEEKIRILEFCESVGTVDVSIARFDGDFKNEHQRCIGRTCRNVIPHKVGTIDETIDEIRGMIEDGHQVKIWKWRRSLAATMDGRTEVFEIVHFASTKFIGQTNGNN